MKGFEYRNLVKNNKPMILDDKVYDLIEKAEEIWNKLDSNNGNVSDSIDSIDSDLNDMERKSLNNLANERGKIRSYIENNSDKSVKALWDKMLTNGLLTKEKYDLWLKKIARRKCCRIVYRSTYSKYCLTVWITGLEEAKVRSKIMKYSSEIQK